MLKQGVIMCVWGGMPKHGVIVLHVCEGTQPGQRAHTPLCANLQQEEV